MKTCVFHFLKISVHSNILLLVLVEQITMLLKLETWEDVESLSTEQTLNAFMILKNFGFAGHIFYKKVWAKIYRDTYGPKPMVHTARLLMENRKREDLHALHLRLAKCLGIEMPWKEESSTPPSLPAASSTKRHARMSAPSPSPAKRARMPTSMSTPSPHPTKRARTSVSFSSTRRLPRSQPSPANSIRSASIRSPFIPSIRQSLPTPSAVLQALQVLQAYGILEELDQFIASRQLAPSDEE